MNLKDQLRIRPGFVFICMIAVLGLLLRYSWVQVEMQRVRRLRDRLQQLVSNMGARFEHVQVLAPTFNKPPDGVRMLGWVSNQPDRNELFDRVMEVKGVTDPHELMRGVFVRPSDERR